MIEKISFPLRYGRGHSKVTVYNRTTALPYYRISYRLGAIRHQRTFKSLEEAKIHAKAISMKLCSQDVTVAQIKTSELVQLQAAKEILSPINCRVDVAANRYAKASKMLGDVSLENAVRFYLSHNSPSNGDKSVAELVAHFLSAKKEDGVSEAYYRDLQKRTRTFVEYVKVPAAGLTSDLIAGYFKNLGFADVNHNNQLRVMRVLLNFAKAQGYLSDGIEYLKSVSQRRIKKGAYPIYQPEEFEALLKGAEHEMLAPLVLLGFCGVRPAEMRRLQWKDIRFSTRTLVLDALISKTASRRTVPICEAALAWLRPHKCSHGQIWSNTDNRWSKSLHRLHQRVKVYQQPNALRHSYISYRLTLTGDVNRTALESGNSAAIIHSHYHALVEDPRLASQWFKVGMLCQSNDKSAAA